MDLDQLWNKVSTNKFSKDKQINKIIRSMNSNKYRDKDISIKNVYKKINMFIQVQLNNVYLNILKFNKAPWLRKIFNILTKLN